MISVFKYATIVFISLWRVHTADSAAYNHSDILIECERSPEDFKFCSNSSQRRDVDVIVEVKPWLGKTVLCDDVQKLSATLDQFFKGFPICAIRRREDLVVGASYSDMLLEDDMGWTFITSRTEHCNMDTLSETRSYFLTVYHCFESGMIQSEISLIENVTDRIKPMEKVYLTNSPAVLEAFHSKRNPIWNRLTHDQSLFTSPKREYCKIELLDGAEVLLSGQGALLESQKSLEEHTFGRNSLELRSADSDASVWTYQQNMLKNVHKMLTASNGSRQLILRYSSTSEDEATVFALPIKVISGEVYVTCGMIIPVGPIVPLVKEEQVKSVTQSSGLSSGEIAGIVVGVALTFSLILLAMIWLVLYCRKWRSKLYIPSYADNDAAELENLRIESPTPKADSNRKFSFDEHVNMLQQQQHNPHKRPYISIANEPPLSPNSFNGDVLDQKHKAEDIKTTSQNQRNGERERKISRAKEENIYCELDDFRSFDSVPETTVCGGVDLQTTVSQVPSRRSGAVMVAADTVNVLQCGPNMQCVPAKSDGYLNDQRVDRSDNNGISNARSFNPLSQSTAKDLPDPTVKRKVGKNKKKTKVPFFAHQKKEKLKRQRGSVVRMVNNEIYSGSEDDSIALDAIADDTHSTDSHISNPDLNLSSENRKSSTSIGSGQSGIQLPVKKSNCTDDESSFSSSDEELPDDPQSVQKTANSKYLSDNEIVESCRSESENDDISRKNNFETLSQIQLPAIVVHSVSSSDENSDCDYTAPIKVTRSKSEDSENSSCSGADSESPYEVSANTNIRHRGMNRYGEEDNSDSEDPYSISLNNNTNSREFVSAKEFENPHMTNPENNYRHSPSRTLDPQRQQLLRSTSVPNAHTETSPGETVSCNKHKSRHGRRSSSTNAIPTQVHLPIRKKHSYSSNSDTASSSDDVPLSNVNDHSSSVAEDPYLLSNQRTKDNGGANEDPYLLSSPHFEIRERSNTFSHRDKQQSSTDEDPYLVSGAHLGTINKSNSLSCGCVQGIPQLEDPYLVSSSHVLHNENTEEDPYLVSSTRVLHNENTEEDPYLASTPSLHTRERSRTFSSGDKGLLNTSAVSPLESSRPSSHLCLPSSGDYRKPHGRESHVHPDAIGPDFQNSPRSSFRGMEKRPSIVEMVDNDIYSTGDTSEEEHTKKVKQKGGFMKRPSVPVMVDNEVYSSSSDSSKPSHSNNQAIKSKRLKKTQHSKNKVKDERKAIASDNYINTGRSFFNEMKHKFQHRKKPKDKVPSHHHQYEIVPEKLTDKRIPSDLCPNSEDENHKTPVPSK